MAELPTALAIRRILRTKTMGNQLDCSWQELRELRFVGLKAVPKPHTYKQLPPAVWSVGAEHRGDVMKNMSPSVKSSWRRWKAEVSG